MHSNKKPSERDLVQAALDDAEGIQTLREKMVPLVDAIAKHYSSEYGVSIKELRPVGLTYLRYAAKKYASHTQALADEVDYQFSTYFTWWITASFETYLDITDEPLRRITPRQSD